MGTKMAEKAVVRDQGLGDAFREGFREGREDEEAVEYVVTLIKNHSTVASERFEYLDGAISYAAKHLHQGSGHDVRITCRSEGAVRQVTTGEDDVIDAEIVE